MIDYDFGVDVTSKSRLVSPSLNLLFQITLFFMSHF